MEHRYRTPRQGTAPGRTRRLRAALLALTATGGLLLTACSASDGGHSSADRSNHSAGLPAPYGTGADGSRSAAPDESRSPSADHLSTFALDVDTASYGYARRVLDEGRLPDPSQVRPEEFVNSFRQDYERPDGNGFTVSVDGARTDRTGWSLVRVGLATRAAHTDDRPPAALTFVVDVSGSMGEPGRLDLAKRSLGAMTDRLRDGDSVALVTFSDEARTVLPMTRLAGHRGKVHDAIDELETEDSTNLGAGVEKGYATAAEGLRKGATNRVVLVSDGLANTGDTDPDTILERISRERRDHGITLFGVGVGSDYGDALMERLADKGDGHTAYVSGDDDARKVFVDQLPQNVDLTARDAKAQVAFDPETVAEFHLVGYEDRKVADEDFRDDNVDGGEVGPGHTVTALYAVRTRPGADGHLATASVRWLDPGTRAPHEESGELETGALHDRLWTAPHRLQVAAVAAYFADALRTGNATADRTGALPGNPGLARLGERAHALADATEDKDVQHLAEAIDEADLMK
ncbi:von Willebrand factor type A domain-containing protein [Streptomyces gilvifuscus]|uniref:von Willebrand factor type A domain-containing protein n=1 Tax=Streptomyces gilvifuscus TaxID=1550617 RepID=A0ABT5FM38_9ACTN|nr:VWA domain-containing protein [Streptomyces gilvifuscus]MDC2953583.1 von Willebrand factor type A domain-containing protein [Streptomyces gilvifuscus]